MPPSNARSLREVLRNASDTSSRFLWGTKGSACLHDLARGSCLGGHLSEFTGRSVLLATQDQLVTALALIELDGTVRRLTLCPPELTAEQLSSVIADADADAVISDLPQLQSVVSNYVPIAGHSNAISANGEQLDRYSTEWVLLTSGTTRAPKLVLHSLSSLTAAIKNSNNPVGPTTWGTFYDISRYGGLQILLRAILGSASMVLSRGEEPLGDHLARMGRHGVTHVLGTPTHWRRALMSPLARAIALRYVRLSGEIADQSILNALRKFYPDALIAHAFASTEAGVGFAVNDGLEGFPASLLGGGAGDVKLKVEHDSLRICSAGTAVRYLGGGGSALRDDQGFVDTGDAVELRDGRYYFLGRMSGVINVGGLKVHPEEVETVINRHPNVRMSLVRARRNPIMGSIVIADVILREEPRQNITANQDAALKGEILQICRAGLAKHKIPTAINIVPSLAVGDTGKLIRHV
jgi:acyl-coenzyme A synthetase/AMP-(fatty) acid ligase